MRGVHALAIRPWILARGLYLTSCLQAYNNAAMTIKQFARAGGYARAAKLTLAQKQSIGRAGGLERARRFKLQASKQRAK